MSFISDLIIAFLGGFAFFTLYSYNDIIQQLTQSKCMDDYAKFKLNTYSNALQGAAEQNFQIFVIMLMKIGIIILSIVYYIIAEGCSSCSKVSNVIVANMNEGQSDEETELVEAKFNKKELHKAHRLNTRIFTNVEKLGFKSRHGICIEELKLNFNRKKSQDINLPIHKSRSTMMKDMINNHKNTTRGTLFEGTIVEDDLDLEKDSKNKSKIENNNFHVISPDNKPKSEINKNNKQLSPHKLRKNDSKSVIGYNRFIEQNDQEKDNISNYKSFKDKIFSIESRNFSENDFSDSYSDNNENYSNEISLFSGSKSNNTNNNNNVNTNNNVYLPTKKSKFNQQDNIPINNNIINLQEIDNNEDSNYIPILTRYTALPRGSNMQIENLNTEEKLNVKVKSISPKRNRNKLNLQKDEINKNIRNSYAKKSSYSNTNEEDINIIIPRKDTKVDFGVFKETTNLLSNTDQENN